MTELDQLVRTVLYEGYALYPYRPSALKNQRRFAFGAVYPRAWAERAHEPFLMRSECVFDVREGGTEVAICVRFLALQRGGGADEHVIDIPPLAFVEAHWRERCTRGAIRIDVEVGVHDAGAGLWRISVELANITAIAPDTDRETAMDVTMASTHTLLRAVGARAISAIDPPEAAAAAIASCRTLGVYPVLAARDTVLASPIVLPDFPELAPTSPGDFFDGTEMDEMLTLRVLTLTEAEKGEAAAADPRIAEMLARTEARGLAATARLHGVTQLGNLGLTVGTQVVLRPSGRADAFDLLLAGKRATVVAIERDLDGRIHCAVTVDEDPGADLGARGLPGHRFFFRPDELEVPDVPDVPDVPEGGR